MINPNKKKKIEEYLKYKGLDDYLLHDVSDTYKGLKKIVISDCDGIISTNESMYSETGKSLKSYGCYDKEMIKILEKCGWEFLFVTNDLKGYNITKSRIDDLDKELQLANEEDRVNLVDKYKNQNYIVVFIGDSLTDIPAMTKANYTGTTYNAPNLVKDFCDYISIIKGGIGGFADVIWSLHKYINDKYKIL